MRVTLVLDRFDPSHGGLEHWAWQWTRWLLDRGHGVDVVASAAASGLERPGLAIHTIGFAASRLAFAERVERHLDRLGADLVHDLGVGWRYDILQPQFGTRLADDRRNLRSFGTARRLAARLSPNRRRRLAEIRALERRQYGDAGPRDAGTCSRGHVVAVSGMTRDDLVREHGLAESRISVIHNGVATGHFRPAPAAARAAWRRGEGFEDTTVLAFAAHNFRLKGLDVVLAALARIRRCRPVLLVAGRGPVEKYRRRAGRLGLAERVRFLGQVEDMPRLFGVAHAFVQPTFYDPCSLTILEAAGCGTPVLTSRFNGASELFADGLSASIVQEPHDVGEVTRRIERLLDPDERRRLADAGLGVARAASAERSFERLEALCRERLRGRPAIESSAGRAA
jgi:UDP-glucose:(heptosyl)LPS alpha-1,3-glucosyltransferase